MHGKGTATKASYPVQVTTVKGRTASASGDWHSVANAQVQPNPTATTSYGYDTLYRLTSVNNGATSYSYDPVGNRLTKNATSYTYDRADRILTAGSVGYTVNANGNLTARGSDSFVYDQANRLVSATVGGATSTYAYDGDGKRTSQTVGGTTTSYVYDVNTALPNVLTDGTLKYVYGLGLTYAVDSSGNVQVYHTDGLGSVRAITDANGNVIQTYQTDEFGVPIQTQGGVSQPFQFTGQQRAATSGLYYLRARMYDPSIGRFLTWDPLVGTIQSPFSLHRSTYVQNNPVNTVDPLGLKPQMLRGGQPGVQYEYSVQACRTVLFLVRDCWNVTVVNNVQGQLKSWVEGIAGPGGTITLSDALIISSTEVPQRSALLAHELGHVHQARALGAAYLITYVAIHEATKARLGTNDEATIHKYHPMEIDANNRAKLPWDWNGGPPPQDWTYPWPDG